MATEFVITCDMCKKKIPGKEYHVLIRASKIRFKQVIGQTVTAEYCVKCATKQGLTK